jgi:hypothetical protein
LHAFVLPSALVLPGQGEKLIICGVKGVHLVELGFAEAVVESMQEAEELPEGLPPSASPSTMSSVKQSILQPRLRASAPESMCCVPSESEAVVDELGDVARVLATEPWFVFGGISPVMLGKAATECGARWPKTGRGGTEGINLLLASVLLR